MDCLKRHLSPVLLRNKCSPSGVNCLVLLRWSFIAIEALTFSIDLRLGQFDAVR